MTNTVLPCGKRSRKQISKRVRFFVLHRDGFKCRYCGAGPDDDKLEVDHFVPIVRGGSDDPSNLLTSCKTCNLGKGGGLVGSTDESRLRALLLDATGNVLDRIPDSLLGRIVMDFLDVESIESIMASCEEACSTPHLESLLDESKSRRVSA